MPHGTLTVIVESAVGIKDPSKHGMGDSYCILKCGIQALSTHVAEGAGSHPIFRTEFKFEIDRSTNDLVVSVYSTGSMGDDELVGSTKLDFKTVFFNAHEVPLTAYPLSRPSGLAGGLINISLKFKARPSPYPHNPHARRHQHPTPPHARNQQETYEDGYGSSGSSESSRSSRRSEDRPLYTPSAPTNFRRQPEQYYASPRADYNHENYVHPDVHQAQPRYHNGACPTPQNRTPAAAAHQAIPTVMPPRVIPTAVNGGIPHRRAGPPQVARQQQPSRMPQPAQRVQCHQQQPQQQQAGVMAKAAGQVAQVVVNEVARQSIQAVAGGFGDFLGGLLGGD